MATPSPFTMLLLALSLALLLTTSHVQAQSPSAPAPAPGPLNLTATLVKAGQYTTLLRLLGSTQVGIQIVNQVNNSDQGLTLLAPTDNAFNNLKAGTLNGLTTQQQVELLLYHVLPKFYTLAMFETVSNPVRTQASGSDGGLYNLNFSSSANQVNVSSGIVETQINNAIRSDFPLAVYQLDKVLLPLDIFGPKPNVTAKAPPPSSPSANRSPPVSSTSSGGPSASADSTPNAGSREMNVRWSAVVGVGLMMIMGTVW
ncbi:fasciclin-like arabinogalactan protein 13 [Magnolia sinica]|uniref:fasciclin-like arabinogalactan protein 13 n=1 Tax=Magnolia sinica TaxID=86752 RepID=UPI00265B47A6|nr:fasciclin-like arabinogalactan protein 13 [Magnolia sinica]